MIGTIVLVAALAFSLMSMVMYYLSFRGYKNAINYARIAYHGMAMLVIVASTLLWYALLTHQYEYKYVFSYSNNSLKTGFLLASFWGGQEGSFMLWLLLTSIIGIFLQSYSSKRGDLEQRVMTIFTLATTFLLIMVSPWFKNPFEFIWASPMFIEMKAINAKYFNLPFIQSFLFTDQGSGNSFIQVNSDLRNLLANSGITINQFIVDGRGLNPQLLNFWMQIHPPILFTGFSMATVPFSFAIAALMKNDYKDWVRQAFPWLLAGMGILGLGIMLGGYWAYEMLGWGGYWAWDPVENSSFIPWLVGVAGIHTLLVQRKTQAKGGIGKFVKTNLILCILTYVLVLYSTFLTRSGVLGDASVHSFVDPGMIVYLFLFFFIGTFILIGAGSIIYRWKYLSDPAQSEEGLISRELALFTASIVLIAAAIIVIVGTSAPLFGHSVDTFFYNEMNLPIAIIIGLLNGISLIIKWRDTGKKDFIKKLLPLLGVSILISVLIILFGGITQLMIILLTFSTTFALVVNSEIAYKIIRGNKKMLGAYVAHIGISVFILGVIGSAVFTQEKDIDLVKDQTQSAFGYEMTFTDIYPIENNTKYEFNIDVKKGNTEYKVKPVMYISDFNNSLMRVPAILTLPTKDIYFSPLGYEDGTSNESNGKQISVQIGNEFEFGKAKIKYNEFMKPDISKMMSGGDITMGTKLTVTYDGKDYNIAPTIKRESNQFVYTAAEVKEANLKIEVHKIDPQSQKAEFVVSKITGETIQTQPKEVLTVTASIKPFISLVWIGVVIMVFGFFISVARRLPESFIRSS